MPNKPPHEESDDYLKEWAKGIRAATTPEEFSLQIEAYKVLSQNKRRSAADRELARRRHQALLKSKKTT